MKLKTLENECVIRLNSRLNDEYTAFYFYRSASNWCKVNGFDNGYKYFLEESNQELGHAKRIEDFMADWNIMPTLSPVISIEGFFNIADLLDKAYSLEYGLLEKYEEDAVHYIDNYISLYTFINQFIQIQNESVGEYATLINKLSLTNDLLLFDTEVLG